MLLIDSRCKTLALFRAGLVSAAAALSGAAAEWLVTGAAANHAECLPSSCAFSSNAPGDSEISWLRKRHASKPKTLQDTGVLQKRLHHA